MFDNPAPEIVFDETELRDAIEQEFQLRRLAMIDEAAQRFQAEIGRGPDRRPRAWRE